MVWQNLTEVEAALDAQTGPDAVAWAGAQARTQSLTKPPGSLGQLEVLAVWYCGWRGDARAKMHAPQIIVFAGNHGITAQGVSAFPPEVTAQMVANFNAGGAAINQLAKLQGARLDVQALDLDRPTQDFTTGPAMDDAELLTALNEGAKAVSGEADLLVVGEMGIGNTTSAAAIAHLLYGGAASDWVGRGTGVDDVGLALKAAVVRAGAARHVGAQGLRILGAVGGRELAAMAGAILQARRLRIPVLLDGFICTAAAACLEAAKPGALDHCMAAHVSAEGGHACLLERIGKTPLMALDMRLGEASGGAVAIGLLRAALACHNGMATFEEAAVSGG
nr:nicotinate-nucleotide--dimethylbenzimidazole phosphoribosyltransferase [Roseovarius carneus]